MRARCFIATAVLVSISNAFAAISIDPIDRTFTKTGGAGMVLTSDSGTWTASTEADWISIKPQKSDDAGVLCVYVASKNMSTNFK